MQRQQAARSQVPGPNTSGPTKKQKAQSEMSEPPYVRAYLYVRFVVPEMLKVQRNNPMDLLDFQMRVVA